MTTPTVHWREIVATVTGRGVARWVTLALLNGTMLATLAGCNPDAAQAEAANDDAAVAQAVTTTTHLPRPTSPQDPRPIEYNHWQTVSPGEYAGYNQRASLIQRGREIYHKYCIGCHGEHGQGDGPAAVRLITKPRDFTSGIYKFRSTDSSSLPMESDIHRVITRGLSRVSMPAFPLMPETEKVAVIEYIKSFYPRWDEEKDNRKIVPVPPAPADLDTRERQLRGRIVYLAMNCNSCHGIDGAGKGATRTEYVDAWGNPQKPFNFTRGQLKNGDTPEDIYRTFHTGLRSIMPSYNVDLLATANVEAFEAVASELDEAELAELREYLSQFPKNAAEVFQNMSETERHVRGVQNSWDLVAFVRSLRRETSTREAVLGVTVQNGQDRSGVSER